MAKSPQNSQFCTLNGRWFGGPNRFCIVPKLKKAVDQRLSCGFSLNCRPPKFPICWIISSKIIHTGSQIDDHFRDGFNGWSHPLFVGPKPTSKSIQIQLRMFKIFKFPPNEASLILCPCFWIHQATAAELGKWTALFLPSWPRKSTVLKHHLESMAVCKAAFDAPASS